MVERWSLYYAMRRDARFSDSAASPNLAKSGNPEADLASAVTTAVVAHVQLYARFRVLALELSRILSPLLAVSLVTT